MAKYKQTKVPAVEGRPNADEERLRFYSAEIPAEVVATFSVARALEEGGFQRPLDKTRARKIGMLIAGDEKKDVDPAPHFQGGLLAYGTPDEVSFSPSTGTLTIRAPLHLLDGQTRAGGDAWALEHGKVTDYTESVRIVIGATHEEIVRWFLISNMTQRKVPPPTVLLDVATMSGTQQHRKSWLARMMVTLSTEAPFTLQQGSEFKRIVSFATRDGGRLSAYTLYKALNFMLPDELNREGQTVERQAIRYAREALKLYASIYADVWGKVGDDGKLLTHDCYGFTLLAAYARFYKAVKAKGVDDVSNVVRMAWIKSKLDDGLPEGSGSGERAALGLANYAASEANIGPITVAA